ncbi:GNAT family N-acetyltransferase [Lachnospiraceae bacterium ZAX-1]
MKEFLHTIDLSWDDAIEHTVYIRKEGHMVATGSRDRNILKCIGVLKERKGEGLASILVSELIKDAVQAGFVHLFLFTKPDNVRLFKELGFFEIAGTSVAVLLENQRYGIKNFVERIKNSSGQGNNVRKGRTGNDQNGCSSNDNRGRIGCIVANCDPFTLGHLFLAEYASQQCAYVYFFVLSEDRGFLPVDERIQLVKKGVAHLENVDVNVTGDYLISAATFPAYFLKDSIKAEDVYYDLDLEIFCRYFAPILEISTRFVGTEPYSDLTKRYNSGMKKLLPACGVEVVELERSTINKIPVSAGRVRDLLKQGKLEDAKELVPDTTFEYLKNRAQKKQIPRSGGENG